MVESWQFLLRGTKVVILRSVRAGAQRPRIPEEHSIASKARAAAVHSVRERGVLRICLLFFMLCTHIDIHLALCVAFSSFARFSREHENEGHRDG